LDSLTNWCFTGDVVREANSEQLVFMGAIVCVVFGYAMALNLAFGTTIPEYSSIYKSILSLYETILGQFRPFQAMLDKNASFSFQISGWIYFITLLQVLILIVSNSFISIMAHAFQTLEVPSIIYMHLLVSLKLSRISLWL